MPLHPPDIADIDDDMPPLVDNQNPSLTYTFYSEMTPLSFPSANTPSATPFSNPPSPLSPDDSITTHFLPMSQSRSHGKRRDPSYIPRPSNAFILFRSAFIRDRKVSDKVEGNHSSLSKIIGHSWKKLSPDEREKWEAEAVAAQAQHRAMYPDWRFRPGSNALAKLKIKDGGTTTPRRRSARVKDPPDEMADDDVVDADQGGGKATTKEKGKGKNRSTAARVLSLEEMRCAKIADFVADGIRGEELEVAVKQWEGDRKMGKDNKPQKSRSSRTRGASLASSLHPPRSDSYTTTPIVGSSSSTSDNRYPSNPSPDPSSGPPQLLIIDAAAKQAALGDGGRPLPSDVPLTHMFKRSLSAPASRTDLPAASKSPSEPSDESSPDDHLYTAAEPRSRSWDNYSPLMMQQVSPPTGTHNTHVNERRGSISFPMSSSGANTPTSFDAPPPPPPPPQQQQQHLTWQDAENQRRMEEMQEPNSWWGDSRSGEVEPEEDPKQIPEVRKLKQCGLLIHTRGTTSTVLRSQAPASKSSNNKNGSMQAMSPEKVNGDRTSLTPNVYMSKILASSIVTAHRGPNRNASDDYDISNPNLTNATPNVAIEQPNQCALHTERKFLVKTKLENAEETARGALDNWVGRVEARSEMMEMEVEVEVEQEDLQALKMTSESAFSGREKQLSAPHLRIKSPDRLIAITSGTSDNDIDEIDKETKTSLCQCTRNPLFPLPSREHHNIVGDQVASLATVQMRHDRAFEENTQPIMCAHPPPLLGSTGNPFEQDGCSNLLPKELPTVDNNSKAVMNRTTEDRDSTDPSCLDPSITLTSLYTFKASRAQHLSQAMDIHMINFNELLIQTQDTPQYANEGCAQCIPRATDHFCDSSLERSGTPAHDITDALGPPVPFDRPVSTYNNVSCSILKFSQSLAFVKQRLKVCAAIEDSAGAWDKFNISYSSIQTAYIWVLVGHSNMERLGIGCVMAGWYQWTVTTSPSFLISDLSFKLGSVIIPPSSLFTQESLDQSLSDTDGENQNSHRNNRPNITYHIQNCGQVHINSHNSQGNKFTNSGNNAPKIINHGGLMVDPDANDDDSNPLTAEEIADEGTADKDEDTESPYPSRSESCPRESIHSKPIVVPLDPHYQQSGGFLPPIMGQLVYAYPQPIIFPLDARYQQWNGLPPPFMAQSVFPGFSPSFPPGFPTLLPQNDPQYQNQFIGVPPGFIPPPILEEGQSSKRSENSHQAMQQCIPGMAFGASPSPVGNNALENPQQYPTNASSSQVRNFLTQPQVQNHAQPSDIPNNFVHNNVFSDTNHHARESPHRGLPLSDCPLGTREDKVKRLEHLLESALETAKLIQADETIPESGVLSARGSTIFKSLQSLLQSPVRKDPDSQPKAQRRLFSWSQVQIRNRTTKKKLNNPVVE